MSRLSKGYLIAIVGTIIWSMTAVFIRYLTDRYDLNPIQLAFWRDAFACVILIIAFIIIKPTLFHLDNRHIIFFIFYGFELSLFNSLWTISVKLNGAALSTVMVYSSAAFTAIAGKWLFRETLGPIKILAVLLSIGGCVFVSGAYDPHVWQFNTLGVFTGLISGIAFAIYSLLGKASSERGVNPWTALMYTFGIASIFLFFYNVIPPVLGGKHDIINTIVPDLPLAGWGVMLALAMVPTIGGYGLYVVSLTFLPASVANLIATLEPSFTAAQSYFILDERFTLMQIIGSLMIIGGVILLRIEIGSQTTRNDPLQVAYPGSIESME